VANKYDPILGEYRQADAATTVPDFRWVPPDTWEFYINGILVHTWSAASVAPVSGSPIGLGGMLHLTYP
jgi:hypothetical protein